jgi:hypothetical protein
MTQSRAVDSTSGSHDEAGVEATDATGRSVALMLYDPAHLALNLALLERKRPSSDLLRGVLPQLAKASQARPIDVADLATGCGSSVQRIVSLLEFLRDAELIQVDGTKVFPATSAAELKRGAKKLEKAFDELNEGDSVRLEEVEAFALDEGCRARSLADRLGQPGTETCGVCDICAPNLRAVGLAAAGLDSVGIPSVNLISTVADDSRSPSEPAIERRSSRRRPPARREGADDDSRVSEEEVFHAEGFYEDAGSA